MQCSALHCSLGHCLEVNSGVNCTVHCSVKCSSVYSSGQCRALSSAVQYDAKCSSVHSQELGRDKGLVKRFRLGREDRAMMDLD